MEAAPPVEERDAPAFALAPGRGALRAEPEALVHPRSTLFGARGGHCRTAWADFTGLAVGPRGLRLGTRRGVFLLRRKAFARADGPEALARAVLEAIAARPGGTGQLAAMQALVARARRAPRPRLAPAAAALCALAFAFQLAFAPDVELAGVFSATLVSLGEYWRLVTANLLHGGLVHLALNALALAVVGGLAERCLGRAATGWVMGLSALGAMGGCWLAGYEWALGASGVVAGLAGALLALELRWGAALPVAWRLPRRSFLAVLALEAGISLTIPFVAHAAHAGGFAAGFLAALATGPLGLAAGGPNEDWSGLPGRLRLPGLSRAGRALLLSANALLAAAGLAGAARGIQLGLSPDPAGIERRAGVLLALEDVSPWILNNEAWRIAISSGPGEAELDAALALAERAVDETERRDPNVLDTLAEVHFARGRPDAAVAAIDEAIALAPEEPYFREQRRRYLGERAAGDRPGPPEPDV